MSARFEKDYISLEQVTRKAKESQEPQRNHPWWKNKLLMGNRCSFLLTERTTAQTKERSSLVEKRKGKREPEAPNTVFLPTWLLKSVADNFYIFTQFTLTLEAIMKRRFPNCVCSLPSRKKKTYIWPFHLILQIVLEWKYQKKNVNWKEQQLHFVKLSFHRN